MKHKDPEKNYRTFFQSVGSRKPGRGLTGFLGTEKKEQLGSLGHCREAKKKKITPPNSAAQLLQARHSQAMRISKSKGWCLRKQQSPGPGTAPEEQSARDQQLCAEIGEGRESQGVGGHRSYFHPR